MTARHRYAPAISVRLKPSLLAGIRKVAQADQVSMAQAIRSLLLAALCDRATADASVPDYVGSSGTGNVHRVTLALDDVADDLPPEIKNLLTARNRSILSARCDCGAQLRVLNKAPRIVPATSSTAPPSSTSPSSTSIGVLQRPHIIKRFSLEAVFRHRDNCPARRAA